MTTSAGAVFLYASLTAVATGLGALPFLFVERPSRRWLGTANAAAAGLMTAASLGLIQEGAAEAVPGVVWGGAAGLVFLLVSRKALTSRKEPVALGGLRGADALKGVLIVAVMTAHSFTEGVGVGVSFGGGEALGAFITVAIAVHNVPEGVAISLVLVPRGESVAKAAGWSVVSSLPQPLLAVPAFLFVETFRSFLPAGLGFAAGAMLGMVALELVPDALEEAGPRTVLVTAVLAGAAMLAFQGILRG